MNKVDLSSLNINEYIKTIDINKIEISLKKLKPCSRYKNIIDNISNIIKANLDDIENKFIDYSNHLSKKEKEKVQLIFNYSGYRQKKTSWNFIKN